MSIKIILHETDEIGFQSPRPLMLDSDEIRSVEQFQTTNALSDTVSRITLKHPETVVCEEDGLSTVHVVHIVFEKVHEIDSLIKGRAIQRDYSTLKRAY